MKRKALLLLLLITGCLWAGAQQTIIGGNEGISGFLTMSFEEATQKKNLVIDNDKLSRIFDSTTPFGDVNIFFHKISNDNIKGEYATVFGKSVADNGYRKINDSLYEIYISDPSKMVLFATGKLKEGFAIGSSGTNQGGLNSSNLMGGGIDSLQVKSNVSEKRYKVWSFNPFIYGSTFFIWDRNKNTQALTFKVLFQFPQPKLLIATTDTAIISKKKKNPSFVWYKNDSIKSSNSQKIKLKASQNTILFAFEHFGTASRFNYLDNLHYRLDITKDWSLTSLAQTPSILLENLPPGKHTLYVKYPAEVAKVITYEVEVVPSIWDSPLWYIIGGILLSGIAFYLFYRIRLQKAKEKANRTKLELQAIHAQLNPHFIFNSLSSIQYLMNRNDKENADHYLTELSKLLRHSLNNSDKELVPLSVELKILDSYVRLEQMRFHFQYHLIVDEQMQTDSLSIPPMLVQPLIENAIKHGISGMGQTGSLRITVQLEGDDMEMIITDNGRGFDHAQPPTGLGIRLVNSRIKVLQSQGYIIHLSYSTEPEGGTKAIVQFKNWI